MKTRTEIVDEIAHTAIRLGGLSWVADLFHRRHGRLTTENQEYKYLTFCDLSMKQQRLLEELKAAD